MSGAAFLRVAKLKGGGIISAAARHNRREIQAELGATGPIDPTRSCLNYCLAGPSTADAVAQLAKDMMATSGVVKLRKDAVRAIEAVFSLPVGTAIDTRAYFTDCLSWTADYFGGMANVLSFDVHMDESAPHAHALILPLVNGRMNGGSLVGAKPKLLAMQSHFHERVAKLHGLRKAKPKPLGEAKRRAVVQVLTHMKQIGDAALQSLAWPSIRECIEADPGPFLLALGLVAEPVKPVKPFVDYVTSAGKGPRRERAQSQAKSIDIQGNDDSPKSIDFTMANFGSSEVYVSVDFAQKIASETPTPAPSQTQSNHRGVHVEIAEPDYAAPNPDQQLRSDSGRHLATTAISATAKGLSFPEGKSADDSHGVSDSEQGVTRERDGEHDPLQWCAELGEFITAPPRASRPPPRATGASLDSLVGTGLVTHGRTAGETPAERWGFDVKRI